jgi:hypothetical protein
MRSGAYEVTIYLPYSDKFGYLEIITLTRSKSTGNNNIMYSTKPNTNKNLKEFFQSKATLNRAEDNKP